MQYSLNLRAVMNHLGVSKNQARTISDLVSEVCPRMDQSLNITLHPDGGIAWLPSEARYWFNGSQSPGLFMKLSGVYSDELNPSSELDCLSFAVPWEVLSRRAPDTGHCVYIILTASMQRASHWFFQNMPGLVPNPGRPGLDISKQKDLVYVGKTSRGAARRFREHMVSAANGGQTKFYRVMRGIEGYGPQLPYGVFVVGQYNTENEAYSAEESVIRAEAERGDFGLLNTVCSRDLFAELMSRYPQKKVASAEYAEEALANLKQATERNWQDPEYATSVICHNPRNFDYYEVATIRALARMHIPVKQIASQLNADHHRVAGVIESRTYRRVI